MASRALPRFLGVLSLLWVYAFFLERPEPAPENAAPTYAGAADSFLVAVDKGDGVDDEPDACHSSPEEKHVLGFLMATADSEDPSSAPACDAAPALAPAALPAPAPRAARGQERRFRFAGRFPVFLISDLPPPSA